MLLIGLTGSIATGKSTVSALLTSTSKATSVDSQKPIPLTPLPLIDADLLARTVVEPGTRAYTQIVSTFSSSTPDLLLPVEPSNPTHLKYGGPLNRPALGRRVFGSTPGALKARKQLNAIVHPAVRWAMVRSLLYYYLTGHRAVLLDIPLLFESGLDVFVGCVIVVGVREPRVQMERLRARDAHLTEEDARGRVGSQSDVRVKAERARDRAEGGVGGGVSGGSGRENGNGKGYVLWNDTTHGDLRVQLVDVMSDIEARSRRWWDVLLWVCPVVMVLVAGWEVLGNWRQRRRWEEMNERRSGGELKGCEMGKPKIS